MAYDLEDRTKQFTKDVRLLVKGLKMTIGNQEDCRQLIRSSGSVGANYIEANEALSKKDFIYRCKVARKEAKETTYWLDLIELESTPDLELQLANLIDEATQLMKILGSIVTKSS